MPVIFDTKRSNFRNKNDYILFWDTFSNVGGINGFFVATSFGHGQTFYFKSLNGKEKTVRVYKDILKHRLIMLAYPHFDTEVISNLITHSCSPLYIESLTGH